MKRLTYTYAMRQQDKLWRTEKEDTKIMLKLYDEIIEEAQSLGYTGIHTKDDSFDEAIIYLYVDEQHKKDCYSELKDTEAIFGFCKPLINTLNKILNDNTFSYVISQR